MIKIPYGISNFESLQREHFFFQDRTHFIPKLENWSSKYPVFLRPRRFGKSLFVSLLHHYYGLEYKSKFQNLFGKTYIGRHPTSLANTYMVMSCEFSRINTMTHETTFKGFLDNVIEGARNFLGAYSEFFNEKDKRLVLSQTSPEAVIKTLFGITKNKPATSKIYFLIDEYDHFANELLAFDLERFKSEVTGNGFVRKFYESLKTATRDGIVDRIFITGVSPVTLDSLTSGFNIADNISLNSIFHNMMGFTHAETEELLRKADIPEDKIPAMMTDLRDWYDGYLFTMDAEEPLFNPDMLLYFLKEYGIKNTYPYDMLDMNIVSDYRKIRNIFRMGGEEDLRLEILDKLVKEGSIEFPLTRLFNLEEPLTDDDFLSLLFYMGLLTFEEAMSSDWRYKIPNYVIKKLYFEYFAASYLRKTQFSRSMSPITQTINAMMNEANPEAFLKVVEHVLQENHSNRDEMQFGEKHLKTLIIALLFPYKAFKIHSEYESKRGYPDIFLERIPDRKINFEVVIELKYVKKSAAETVDSIVEEAKTQIDNYMKTERFSRPDVRGFYIVFLGGTVYKWGEAVKIMP